MKADLAKAKTNLALEKERWEVEVMKAKKEFAEAGKRAWEKAVGEYKASLDLVVEKAQAVAIFHTLEEFYANHCAFNEDTFEESYKLGKLDCCTQVEFSI